MLPLLLLLVLPSAYSQNFYIFDGVQYTRQTILTTDDNEIPMFLSVNPKTDQLYFNLVNADKYEYGKLHTLKYGELLEFDDTSYQVAAVDVTKDQLYVGTADGVITVDDETAGYVGLANESISYLFKPLEGDKLFAITADNTVYELDLNTLEETRVDLISPAYKIVTDREGNIFYHNESGIYVLLKDLNEPFRFVGLNKDLVSALTVDHKNRVIVTAAGGLYWLKTNSIIPVKLMNLDFTPRGIVFKNDKIYISEQGVIYKFTH